jgi:hypothetical protein
VALLAAIGVAAALIAGAPADGRSTRQYKPSLTLTRGNPVTISGHHFTARKRVRVVLIAGLTRSRTLKTSRTGAFTVRFSALIDRCGSWSVTATQPHRRPVVLKSPAKPLCPPG